MKVLTHVTGFMEILKAEKDGHDIIMLIGPSIEQFLSAVRLWNPTPKQEADRLDAIKNIVDTTGAMVFTRNGAKVESDANMVNGGEAIGYDMVYYKYTY